MSGCRSGVSRTCRREVQIPDVTVKKLKDLAASRARSPLLFDHSPLDGVRRDVDSAAFRRNPCSAAGTDFTMTLMVTIGSASRMDRGIGPAHPSPMITRRASYSPPLSHRASTSFTRPPEGMVTSCPLTTSVLVDVATASSGAGWPMMLPALTCTICASAGTAPHRRCSRCRIFLPE